MNFEDYCHELGKLSNVKLLIIQELWDSGNKDLPRAWVKSSKLLDLTQQKYFDRRIRELRDEVGCDIETQPINGEHCYRLVSTTISKGNRRAYLTAKQKGDLFSQSSNCCQICGGHFAAGVRGLQADHKIPLSRGGGHEVENWQALCNECNVGKRRACAGCDLECLDCSWAFPEKVGRTVAVRIPSGLAEIIERQVGQDQSAIEKALI
ncbi:MAG: HNH endonuclease, partial [Akkermansiaceae bacterium]|nr:HNH endonuclease [Akkermansiaceae bacterium]